MYKTIGLAKKQTLQQHCSNIKTEVIFTTVDN